MLSKSQAKGFFLFGTGVCALVFIGLTMDTFKKIPAQTKTQNLTENVIRGKHLWDSNNCMGCHTIMGEGAYYAPELTKVFARRGESYIRSMLKDPQAMFPNGRKMTNYHFKDGEIDDLVAFLKWVGEMDLNGFPPEPDLGVKKSNVQSGMPKPAVVEQTCLACHSIGNVGGKVGPSLDGIGSRREAAYLKQWLQDPQVIKPGTTMPKLALQESEINEVVQFLSQLKESN